MLLFLYKTALDLIIKSVGEKIKQLFISSCLFVIKCNPLALILALEFARSVYFILEMLLKCRSWNKAENKVYSYMWFLHTIHFSHDSPGLHCLISKTRRDNVRWSFWHVLAAKCSFLHPLRSKTHQQNWFSCVIMKLLNTLTFWSNGTGFDYKISGEIK